MRLILIFKFIASILSFSHGSINKWQDSKDPCIGKNFPTGYQNATLIFNLNGTSNDVVKHHQYDHNKNNRVCCVKATLESTICGEVKMYQGKSGNQTGSRNEISSGVWTKSMLFWLNMSVLHNCTAFLIGVIIAFAFYLRHRFTYWSRHGVGGRNYCDLGSFFTKYHDWTNDQVKKYGRVFGTYDLFRKRLVINEPDLIRDIMVKDFHVFPDHKYFNEGSSKMKLGLFFLPGNAEWKRIRSIVTPSFTPFKVKSMMTSISELSDKLIHNLEEYAEKGKTADIRKYVGGFAMDVICSFAYGINIDSVNNPDHPIVVNVKKILGIDFSNLSFIMSIIAPPIAKFFKMEFFDLKAIRYLDFITNKIVEERKLQNNQDEDEKKKRTDFLQLMIDRQKRDEDSAKEQTIYNKNLRFENGLDIDISKNNNLKSNRSLSSDELTAQGMVFFIAGYDSTSASISHSIYYLSQYQECQQKLYEELKTISEFSYESLNELEYLNAVIKETLRLAPSFTRYTRECLKDYKLGNTGITIPAGTSIEMLPYALHRDPEFFPEPEIFKPERFISKSGEPTHHPYAYIPFGGGPRVCIGIRLALNEMRMCIAKLVNKFEFKLAPDFKIDYFNGNLLMSPKQLMVDIKARKI